MLNKNVEINQLAAELQDLINYINIFKFEDVGSTKVVRGEYVNILDRSVNAFYAETQSELDACKEDISNSYSVIESMADITNDPLAKLIIGTEILEKTNSISFTKNDQSVIDYCDSARAISIASRC